MAEAIKMPELGQTVSEGTIVEWLVAEGDEIDLGDPLVTVETDKTQLDVECVAEGTVLKLLVKPEDVVEAGTVIAYVGEPGETPPA